MSIEVKVPKLPESVEDATIAAWHKRVGDKVRRNENLVDLETDKVVLEVPAPADGYIAEINFKVGDVVKSDALLAVLSDQVVVSAAAPATPKPVTASPQQAAMPEKSAVVVNLDQARSAERAAAKEVLAPSVRRLVDEYKLDPGQIPSSGKDGRLTKADVLAYQDQQNQLKNAGQPHPTVAIPVSKPEIVATPVPTPESVTKVAAHSGRTEQRVPMTRLRARIAERLVMAQQTAAMLTTFNEVNLAEVNALRYRYKDKFEKDHGTRLGYMSFYVKACVEALKRFPVVNASVDGNDIVYHGYFDIGIAVAAPRGLVVPILRDADQLGFAQIEKGIRDFSEKAKNGNLSMEDLTGGTFSITNGGVFGSLLSTPILNPPQSAILGMHSIQDRPIVVDGQIVIRPMMNLALTYDHRVIDGKDAVQFLVAVKELLEDPARLLLQV